MYRAKECRDCDRIVPLEGFWPDGRRASGYSDYCRPCRVPYLEAVKRACTADWAARNPERAKENARRSSLKRNGWVLEDRDRRFEELGGLCENPRCERPIGASDHDHVTGAGRWLLCVGCNFALGHASDDPERLLGLSELLTRITV